NDDSVMTFSMDPSNSLGWTPDYTAGAHKSIMCMGGGGAGQWPIDNVNGTIITVIPHQSPRRAIPQTAWRGFDLDMVNWTESAFKSVGFRVTGSGHVYSGRTRISDSAAGNPTIDTPLVRGSVASIVSAGANYQVGDQLYDRLGGILIVDSIS